MDTPLEIARENFYNRHGYYLEDLEEPKTEPYKYVKYTLTDRVQAKELVNHLQMNGYHMGFDSMANAIFVYDEESDYVETIMDEREIKYERDV